MKIKQFLVAMLIGAAAFAGGGWMYGHYEDQNSLTAANGTNTSIYTAAKYTDDASNVPTTDFESAAAKASPAVVHIKVMKKMGDQGFSFFGFDNQGGSGNMPGNSNSGQAREVASGSGVLVSANGYIVTNNHVVDHADGLTVTLNDKNDYKAKVIGTDPASDLAIIKIEGSNFPYLNFANSDKVRVGQWILAIGYPLDLQSTVTSGIVSALSRSIDINSRNSQAPLESFIQTDAAVNPGNSGGALVNTDGELIGINSAIASPTGSFAGYSYAIPSNIVARVAGDIIKYGSAKRAYLGIMFGNDQMSEAVRQKNNIPNGNGVYVMDAANGSAASDAGIRKGDFITKLNGAVINTGTELVGKISALRPGDKVNITYMRNGEENTTTATLQGNPGNYPQQQQQEQLQQQQQQQEQQEQQQPDGDQ
ncbi:MAG TPA: trypsin-like peptidase domain-containing protein [Hanamia sp.]